MKNLNKLFIAALALSIVSCDNDFDNPVEDFVVTSGDAKFDKYIALGNSLTSGFRDNALFRSGQESSYPNMLAGLMKAAGGGEFKTPYMPNDMGGFTDIKDAQGNISHLGKLTLKIIDGSLTPVPSAPAAALDNVTAAGPYQNMGVPGAKSYHLLIPGYGQMNPYFTRFAKSATTSVVADAAEQKPTFFSLWIGNNDVLSYATAGGAGGVDRTGNPDFRTYGPNDISDPALVKDQLSKIITAMKTAGATGGVIANIPSVTAIPYFTTVPSKPISGLNDATVGQLNGAYARYNGGLAQAKAAGLITDAEYQQRLIKFTAGAVANGAVIEDKDLTNLAGLSLPSYRQTTTKDLIVFTALAQLRDPAINGGTVTALADQWVLTEKEVARVETAVTKYNAAIAELATANNLALVDTYTEMQNLKTGIKFYGQTYTAAFISGGAFSLDGVHLTGNGYAIVANMFVDAINKKYGSTLRKVNPGNYPGIAIP